MLKALIFLSLIVGIYGACQKGDVGRGTKCYSFYKDPLPFVTAETACNKQGGHLVSIADGYTNAFIAQQTKLEFDDNDGSIDFWIGATSLINPGNWSWTDGTQFTYAKFRKRHIESIQNCVTLSLTDGKWNAIDCSTSKPYVCESGTADMPVNTIQAILKPSIVPLSYRLPCPRGWTFYERLSDCYLLTPSSNWSTAEDYCIKHSSHLTSIHSWEQIQYLWHLDEYHKWTGLYKFVNDKVNEWKWANDVETNFLFWGGQGSATCAYLDRDHIHSNWECKTVLRGVCQKAAFS